MQSILAISRVVAAVYNRGKSGAATPYLRVIYTSYLHLMYFA